MQMVFLTARPGVFADTVAYVRHFMPFVDEIVALCPESVHDQMPPGVTVLGDTEITGLDADEITALDHQSRNYRLRTAMLSHPSIAEQFIMADDDNRPLGPVDRSFYLDDAGRYRNYWFYDLANWGRDTTPFDQGITHALLVLPRFGLADQRKAYSSHMPQIVDRELFSEVAAIVAEPASKYPMDEWSTYFNGARSLAPDRFAPPEPYATLGWPQFPGLWPQQVVPAEYRFENFHEEMYESDGLFAGMSAALALPNADANNLEKVVRWHRFGLAVARLEFPDDVTNPWVKDSKGRKLFFKGTKALKKVVDYATMEDKATLAELQSRISELEDRLDP